MPARMTCPKWMTSIRAWREPDDVDEGAIMYEAIWYGPEYGDPHFEFEDIENAVWLEYAYPSGIWTVREYQDVRGLIEDPPDRFLVTTVEFVDRDIDAWLRACGMKIPKSIARKARLVAAMAAAYRAEYGGKEDWDSELPRFT